MCYVISGNIAYVKSDIDLCAMPLRCIKYNGAGVFFLNLFINNIIFYSHILYNAASLSRIFCNNGICSNLQILHLDVQVSSTNRIHMINLMIETINFVNVFTQFYGS